MTAEAEARLTDIFISYSSKGRPVALRVRDALQAAGYDVFWDQATPAGQDWDSWIRERLTGAHALRCVHCGLVTKQADRLFRCSACNELLEVVYPELSEAGPAFAAYMQERLFALLVIDDDGERVAHIHAFADPRALARFDLPVALAG